MESLLGFYRGAYARTPIVRAHMQLTTTARRDVVRFLDSYASLLVLLLANLLLLELVDDPRWGAIGSTILAALALVRPRARRAPVRVPVPGCQ